LPSSTILPSRGISTTSMHFSPFHLCPLTDFYFSLSHCEASVSQDQGKYEASLAEPRYEDED
jgi:hypothetical protein